MDSSCVIKNVDKFNGTIVFIGTPAEETVGGKVPMVRVELLMM